MQYGFNKNKVHMIVLVLRWFLHNIRAIMEKINLSYQKNS